MSGPRRQRRRAVRLTPDGLELLKAALFQRWESDARTGKLTREARAELLGLSIATAERVISGNSVDRATLSLSFKNLGLSWDDAFVDAEPGDSTCETSERTEAMSLAANPVPKAYGRTRWARVAFVMTSILAVIATRSIRPPRPESINSQHDDQWQRIAERSLTDGTHCYQVGEYARACILVDQALDISRNHELAGTLASSLKIAGDLAAERGAFTNARSNYSDALAIRDALSQTGMRPALLEAIGDVEMKSGEYQSAMVSLTQSREGFQRASDSAGVAMAARDLGSVCYQMGDLGSAMAYFRTSLGALSGLNKPDMEADILGRRALVLQRRQRFGEARSDLRYCLKYWSSKNHQRWIADTKFKLATVERSAGNTHLAVTLLQECKSDFERVGDAAAAKRASRELETLVENDGSASTLKS